MAEVYKISSKQTLLDVCLQVYGTSTLLYTLAKDNGLQIDSSVDIGDQLEYDKNKGIPRMKNEVVRKGYDIINDGDDVGSFSMVFMDGDGITFMDGDDMVPMAE